VEKKKKKMKNDWKEIVWIDKLKVRRNFLLDLIDLE